VPRFGCARQPRLPNLTDNDWLYGGEPETIQQTITKGRNGMMPSFASTIDAKQAGDTAQYVRSLSGLSSDPIRASRGESTFKSTCAACHGANGKGNQALGAPNLTDNTGCTAARKRRSSMQFLRDITVICRRMRRF
jgi:cytochrome c oxidase cbb3-type subunit 3